MVAAGAPEAKSPPVCAGVPTTIAPEVHAIWQATQDHEGADSDFTAVAKEVERRVGISLRAKS